jgi:hypothetical protein
LVLRADYLEDRLLSNGYGGLDIGTQSLTVGEIGPDHADDDHSVRCLTDGSGDAQGPEQVDAVRAHGVPTPARRAEVDDADRACTIAGAHGIDDDGQLSTVPPAEQIEWFDHGADVAHRRLSVHDACRHGSTHAVVSAVFVPDPCDDDESRPSVSLTRHRRSIVMSRK